MHRRMLLLMVVPAFAASAVAQPVRWSTETYWGELKKKMHIQPRQEAAWTRYTSTVEKASEQSGHQDSMMFDAMGTATWKERCHMMNRTLHDPQAADAAHKAAAELRPMLDQTQKAEAPAMLPGYALEPGPGLG